MISCISSGELSGDGIVSSDPTRVSSVLILTDGTNAATVILYDNTAASGTKVFEAGIPGAELSYLFDFPIPIACKSGLYLDIDGTGASCIVYTA